MPGPTLINHGVLADGASDPVLGIAATTLSSSVPEFTSELASAAW